MSFMEVNFFETALASGSKTSGYSKNQYDNDDIDDSSYPDFLK
jgi:hypothetical protein